MMPPNCKYALLLTSMPRHPQQLFSARQTPISQLQFEQRLALLEAEDAAELQRIVTLVHWSQFRNETDQAVVTKCRELMALTTDGFLKQLVLWHLEVRTVLTALRQRNKGAQAPESKSFQGFGDWPEYIEKNWHESDFGIGNRLPWIICAQDLLEGNKPFELEKFLLDLIWQHYEKIGSRHFFDFPAVVIYVLRWYLTDRWLKYNADKAMQRFDKLVQTGLEGFSIV